MNCPHCQQIHGVVEEFNFYLAPEKRINVVDVTSLWEFGVDLEPIANYIDLKGTPTLFLGGKNPQVVEGITSRSYFKGFLKGYLERAGDI